MVTSISKKNTENEKEEVAPFAVISLPATCTFTYGKNIYIYSQLLMLLYDQGPRSVVLYKAHRSFL